MIKTVLVIGYVWPEPNSSAAGTRMLQLVKLFLAQHCNVVFASAAALSEHRFPLSSLGVTEQTIALNCSSFDQLIAELQPDLVLFDRFFTEEQFGWRVAQTCPNALRVLDTEDLHSLRNTRQLLLRNMQQHCATDAERYSITSVNASMEELYALMAEDETAQREIAAIFRCDLSLIISEFEMQLLRQYFLVPEVLLFYCPLWIDCSGMQKSAVDFSARQDFITIGNFRHEPNWDAVLWLKHQLWPGIRLHLPNAELHIYGAYPPPKATQLHNPKQGFHIKGWAEDAHAVMSNARVCLAPLRFGAGIKGKLIDAMQTGTPSVTTSLGAEAMYDNEPWAGAIADTAEDFIAAAIHLYETPIAWQAAQLRGFEILRHRFGDKDFAERLWVRLLAVASDLLVERQRNFVGQMLRNQYHQSLRYKSQWIEAKNRTL